MQVFEFGAISGPDIDLSTLELNYPYVENNFSYSMQLDVINNGNQIAEIIDNYLTNSDFSIVTVPTNTGCPLFLHSIIRSITARSLSLLVL